MALRSLDRAANYARLARHAYQLRHADGEAVREHARRHLSERMGKLRGLPQKLGQMLSFSESADASAGDDAFGRLQEQADPLPFDAVRPVLEAEWGQPLEAVLAEIEPTAHAASLGQVHRAITRDGRDVAVKVQYPGIRGAVHTDLKMLGWLSIPVGNLRRGFDLSGYRKIIMEDLDRELDYRQEAASQRAFAEWAANNPFLVVPQVVDELSTETVLVTDWVEGQPWHEVRDRWPDDDRKQLARGLLETFFHGIFSRKMLHADLHPGNLRFRNTGRGVKLVLYDFGCVYRPSEVERQALLRLIRATRLRNESPFPLLVRLGFDEKYLAPMAEKLPALCRALFEPLCVDYPYSMADWRLAERVSDILDEDRWNFRIAGPPSLILLLRAWHGLIHYLSGLGCAVPWYRALEPELRAHGQRLDAIPLPETADAVDFSGLAKHLKIRVTENGRKKVELTAHASAVDDLHELLDEDLKAKIAQRGIQLDEIVTGVRRRQYAAGPVFDLREGSKQVDVWLT